MDIDPLDTSQGQFPSSQDGSGSGQTVSSSKTNFAPSSPPRSTTDHAAISSLYNGFAPRWTGQGQVQAPLARARSRSSTSSLTSGQPANHGQGQGQGQQRMQNGVGGGSGMGLGVGVDESAGAGPSTGLDTASSSRVQDPHHLPPTSPPTYNQPRRQSYGNLNTPPSPREAFRPDVFAPGSISPSRSMHGKVLVAGFAPLGNPLNTNSLNRPVSSAPFRPNILTNGGERRSSLAQSLRLHNVSSNSPTDGPDSLYGSSASAHSLPTQYPGPVTLQLDTLDGDRTPQSASTSAPPSPSAASILHPPTFIHTHHPRRGSLVPLNLNLISPMPPSPDVQDAVRRESSAFSVSMTPIVGGTPGSASGVPKWTPREMAAHGFARRRSLTPSIATLAPASPTKLLASGSIVRGTVSGQADYHPGRNLSPHRPRRTSRPSVSAEGWANGSAIPFGQKKHGLGGIAAQDAHGRRASQPISSAGTPLVTGEMRRRPSSDKDLLYNSASPRTPGAMSPGHGGVEQDGFTFGGGANRDSFSSARYSPTTSASGASSTAESEAAEAERQRLLFLRAGLGQEPRLSLGGVRRQSHLREELIGAASFGTEGLRRDSLGLASYAGLGIGPTVHGYHLAGEEIARGGDGRRGSIPINIPYDKRSRDTASGSSASIAEDDDDHECEEREARGADGELNSRAQRIDSEAPTITGRRHTLQRPLPPLMPLSDPGRDMLASTLALHRATHMLDSRNLRSEPLPHPLPPSLHPPAPVNVSDFDIDFILQGAVDPYGIEAGDISPPQDSRDQANQPVPVARSLPVLQNLRLGRGGDEEDTFAKFVGAFDEEYDDRRGEWTFKACSTCPSIVRGSPPAPAELYWESPGAGRYLITNQAEVLSQASGRAWRLRRVSGREYEVEDVTASMGGMGNFRIGQAIAPSLLTSWGDGLILAGKATHVDMGGFKMLTNSRRSTRIVGRARVESEDSAMTAKIANLPPSTFAGASRLPKSESPMFKAANVPRAGSMDLPDGPIPGKRGRGGEKVSFLEARRKSKSEELATSPPRESGRREIAFAKDDRKKDRATIGDKIKRSWLGNLSKPGHSSSSSEDKRLRRHEKEKMQQSQSWSGDSSSGSIYSQSSSLVGQSGQSVAPSFISKGSYITNVSPDAPYQPPWILMSDGTPNNTRTGDLERGRIKSESGIDPMRPMLGLGIEDETNSGLGWKEGRAWKNVPAEALAMVVPLNGRSAPEGVAKEQPESRPRTADSLGLGSSKALLVYYVPFSSSDDDSAKSDGKAAAVPERSRSRQRDQSGAKQGNVQPLPFRSFRIVGSIVCANDLRSEAELPTWPEWETPDAEGNPDSPNFSPPASETVDPAPEPSPDPSVAGLSPTVIAVCHSRGQGVEFVLEGLDRLGLCQGKSAWGPHGYEEWRGSGLSPEGRQVLDVIWSGCVAVLGLQASGSRQDKK